LFKNGEKISDIARVLQQPRSTISYIIKRFREAGTVENHPRSGRPRAMDYQQLEKTVKTDRRAPLVEITAKFNEERNVTVSKRTVRQTLKDIMDFPGECAERRLWSRLTIEKKRLAWCREKRWWTTQYQWSKVIFSDESQVCIGQDKRVYVWRKRGEGWRPDLVKGRTDRKFSVMVWGCICYNGVGTLTKVEGNINADKYISILEDNNLTGYC